MLEEQKKAMLDLIDSKKTHKILQMQTERHIIDVGGEKIRQAEEMRDRKQHEILNQRKRDNRLNQLTVSKNLRQDRLSKILSNRHGKHEESFTERIITNMDNFRSKLFASQARKEAWNLKAATQYEDDNGVLQPVKLTTLTELQK